MDPSTKNKQNQNTEYKDSNRCAQQYNDQSTACKKTNEGIL